MIHTPEDLLLSQRYFALNMLYKIDMMDCRPVSTPLERNLKQRLNSRAACNETRFRQIFGSLIYLTITRPDLNYPVRVISQFMQRTTVEYLHYVVNIAICRGSKDRELLYRHGITEQLVDYTDVDWASDASDRWSTSRFMFSLGSAVVAWSSKK